MGRDEHRHRKNKAKLPQTPKNQKDATGVDMEMSNNPQVQFGIEEEKENRD
ncbi:YfhD family protein [Aquibacillus koreensis]|uniref:YfhD family protein n=1 Tax=Aquibacillus koreensis TaxID=279446 RepID=A0A9X3WL71_9BACI|nr:YfhD family protein [Aquibacillus koreensis]MCT2534220.1 YfhD family protein [Aquibacillus koreensis]MDC3420735.1 YfhD family protein [Aquibacillus koreensis]